ncbi:sugar ABC transporter substrate-binding protein [Clostridium sartagoforme]|uniref:Sugar ABC transporter substrate-binding protein n=1 Tax=Clostridium sartagoforme TaxID=84031 RepID=A0A4S2DP29_9CLOT|nr:substrate-binding domain-containing protein [Clostridium sartagoforme]TGY42771.1 sugar ABC transporter substrate-binding protein [Clostridium sartagoforme]
MRIKKKTVFIILFLMVLSSSLLLIREGGKKEVVIYDVAVIIRGRNSEEWSIMKAGMEQASLEMNVNLRFITLLEENSVEEQQDYLQREISSGADAIIISPADYTELSTTIENINKKTPIVLFESTIDTKQDIPYISCDNYELGQSLAEEILRNGNTRNRIIIAKSDLSCSSISDRYDGFIDEISNSKNTYDVVDLPTDDSKLYSKVRSIIEEKEGQVLVAFEPSVLEALGRAKKYIINNTNIEADIEIYGTGRTSTIISLIEENIVDATAMQNDFNVGYLSIKTAVSRIENKKLDSKINIVSTLINSDNMYSKENQKMLFPIAR